MIEKKGDETKIHWLHRTERYQEKLATPDVSMADLIGDLTAVLEDRPVFVAADDATIKAGAYGRVGSDKGHKAIEYAIRFKIKKLPAKNTNGVKMR